MFKRKKRPDTPAQPVDPMVRIAEERALIDVQLAEVHAQLAQEKRLHFELGGKASELEAQEPEGYRRIAERPIVRREWSSVWVPGKGYIDICRWYKKGSI